MKQHKKLLGITVVIMLIISLLTGCAGDAPADTEEPQGVADIQTDVVIIGSGGAGLAAAIEAHDAGKEVIVLEKMPMVGGNTLRATGGLNAAGTSVQAELGIEDSVEVHYEDTMTGGYDMNNPELVQIFTENASDAVEWLLELGGDFNDVGRLGGSTNNRSHRPSGGAAVGPELVRTLRAAVEARDIEIMIETTAIEILSEDGKIGGVVAMNKDGQEFTVAASAVILATGGFGANSTMLVEWDSALEGFGTTNQPGATGDGITMAAAIGAGLVDMEEIQTHPTAVPSNGSMITEAVRGNGAILINKDGQRFVNELATRDVVSEAMLAQEGEIGLLFFGDDIRESLSAIEGYIKQGIVTEGSSIEELAGKLGIDAETLQGTVDTYNGLVDSGVDAEFGRDDMPRGIEEGNVYVIEVGPAVHHTMGGVRINGSAQVLNADGEVIQGLFAAGEAVGGIHGGNRLGGNALADIIVFGRVAGQSAADL
ncbi:flavocytochrome c [Alkaliphilus metalliredigens QYMF]|uniref:Flavocytochrome c n=1 Tax=Alkaliphilus metalliredigens (strain QYMF) TaxID=293826 RepID=A6TMY0_ALKMQ|nr:flavocytochrome c [Alkaliphilus metalliredigens]ABR47548.1 flavocytochrome c [Alkaliphilus metalliredigens QYMF]